MSEESNSLCVQLKLSPEQTKRMRKYFNAFHRKRKRDLKKTLKDMKNQYGNSLKNDENIVIESNPAN